MDNILINHQFVSNQQSGDKLFIISGDTVYLSSVHKLPSWSDIPSVPEPLMSFYHFVSFNQGIGNYLDLDYVATAFGDSITTHDHRGLLIEAQEEDAWLESLLPCDFRSCLDLLDETELALLAMAKNLYNWRVDVRYCSWCSGVLKDSISERAKVCTSCGRVHYPTIQPAIIVLISQGEEMLMVQNLNVPKKYYGLVAGFVEMGESIEQAVHREVAEEVGLKIKNVRYQVSQMWPFRYSLMLAFTADYVSGELCIDTTELADAKWVHKTETRYFPPRGTIARRLIDLAIK